MSSNMQLDIKNIDRRMEGFVKYFVDNRSADPDRSFCTLQSNYAKLDNLEERLFLILLTTHFDSPYLAADFHQQLSWSKMQQIDKDSIHQVCKMYISDKEFTIGHPIGDHRKYLRCLPNTKKINYSATMLISYRHAVAKYASQAAFFEITSHDAEFDVLYQRMKDKEIVSFQKRLPRFDHLERLSRLHHYYVTPNRFYAEDSTGPLYGLTCILFGKRLGKDRGITRQDLIDILPYLWNEQIGGEYLIPDKMNFTQGEYFKEIIKCLERWVVNRVRNWESLPTTKRDDPAFIFDIESCLCNWQKGRCLDGSV